MVWLFAYFQSSFALQSGQPFARHNVLSTAASADCEFGSGAWLDSERFFDLQSTLGRTTLGSCGTRFGEARHPGPHHDYLTVGVSNPGGLRQKEDTLLHLGPGLWSMTETQLSAATMKTCAGLIRQQAKILNRQVRPLFGAPASLRMGSQWAGTWTGVCTCSDWPAATLQIPWPDEHWETGRALLSRHWISGMPVVIGAFYGYAQGPTWPKSKSLSDKSLSTFTTEVVMGMSGVRILQGDFNYEPGEIPQQRIWQQYGWCIAQQLAHELFHHEVVPTCKHTNQRDQIWLSPEAAQLFRGIKISEDFCDHATVAVRLQIPTTSTQIWRWPRPSKIPWDDIDTSDWQPNCGTQFDPSDNTTNFMKEWASNYEKEIAKLHLQQHQRPLPANCQGRSQRVAPELHDLTAPVAKPSRGGEVQLFSSMTGHAVRKWFKQLRRLQSLRFAAIANKTSPDAITYRADLWHAILSSTGFSPNFSSWWQNRPTPVHLHVMTLPIAPPDGHLATQIYEDFHAHFKAFENWHLSQRNASLKAKYEGSLNRLFQDLKDEPKGGANILWENNCTPSSRLMKRLGKSIWTNPLYRNLILFGSILATLCQLPTFNTTCAG